MNIYIVIPVFNRKAFTKECLLSLQRQTYKNFHVIVVDDGSTDGTSDMLAQEFPTTIVIKGDGNLFWTAATNLGIEYAMKHGADYVMTLNNDTIATDTFIEEMVNWSKKKPNALLGALAVDSGSKKIIYGGNRVDWVFHQDKNLLNELKEEEKKGIHPVSYFPGRGLWIPSKVFTKIGLFDEKQFPHYAADYDFTLVAKRAGFEIYCNYDAKLYTYPEASGAAELKKKKTFKNYYNHLFGIKGAGNLKVFTQYTLKNCPKALIPTYLLQGYTRRLLGYWLK